MGQEEWQGQVETQASESNGHTDLADDTIGEESWVVERRHVASARSKAMASKTEDSMTEKTWTKNIWRRQAGGRDSMSICKGKTQQGGHQGCGQANIRHAEQEEEEVHWAVQAPGQ